MFCTNCGEKVPFKTKICPFCNLEIDFEEENQEKKILEPNEEINFEEELDESDRDGNFSRKHSMPLSTSSFFFMQIVFLIPIINIVFLLIWSFKKNTNQNRQAYARSMLIWFLSISVILLFIFIAMLILRYPIDIGFWFKNFKSFINSIPEF